MTEPGPRRIRVVGNSGSGKTTYARAIASRLGLPHLELDAIFWDAGWIWRDLDEAHRLLAGFLTGAGSQGWVADGNWNSRLGDTLDGADTIVWLDFPRWVVMPRVIRRTLWRGVTGRELWHGNRERLGNILRREPEENIIAWSWTAHATYRSRYAELAATDSRVVRLGTPSQARHWLDSLPTAPPESLG